MGKQTCLVFSLDGGSRSRIWKFVIRGIVVEVRPRLTTKHNRSSSLEWLSDTGEAQGVDLVGNWAGRFAPALVRRKSLHLSEVQAKAF